MSRLTTSNFETRELPKAASKAIDRFRKAVQDMADFVVHIEFAESGNDLESYLEELLRQDCVPEDEWPGIRAKICGLMDGVRELLEGAVVFEVKSIPPEQAPDGSLGQWHLDDFEQVSIVAHGAPIEVAVGEFNNPIDRLEDKAAFRTHDRDIIIGDIARAALAAGSLQIQETPKMQAVALNPNSIKRVRPFAEMTEDERKVARHVSMRVRYS